MVSHRYTVRNANDGWTATNNRIHGFPNDFGFVSISYMYRVRYMNDNSE